MKPSQWAEDEQLGRWVGEVTRRWAAAGLSGRRRLDLFARLLGRLTSARTTGTTAAITGSDPRVFADVTAQEWADDGDHHADARRRRFRTDGVHP